MRSSCRDETYGQLGTLRPGDMFFWATDVKPDFGYSYGAPRSRYEVPRHAIFKVPLYLLVSIHVTVTVITLAEEKRLVNLYVWDYVSCSFKTIVARSPTISAYDVFVLRSAAR